MSEEIALQRIEEARKTGATSVDLSKLDLTSITPEIMQGLKRFNAPRLKVNQRTAFPPEISEEPGKLTSLDLSFNQLTELPSDFSALTNLTWLKLSSNQLTALPHDFSALTALQDLNLSRNQLTALPHDFSALTALQYLYLSSNQLTALPHDFSALTALQDLYLSSNQLTALPHDFSALTALQHLILSRNQLTALPRDFSALTALQFLILSRNQLTALPLDFSALTALRFLSLSRNQLTALPHDFSALTALQYLYLSSNQLTALPHDFSALTALQDLYLSSNQLTALPHDFSALTALQHLILSRNQLTALPRDFSALTALRFLSLSRNQLTALPHDFSALTALQHLYLEGNQLTALPLDFSALTALQHLYLSSNQLTTLPHDFSALTALQHLYLSSNQLTALPHDFSALTALQYLDLEGNPLTSLPLSPKQARMPKLAYDKSSLTDIPFWIRRQDTEAICNYSRKLQDKGRQWVAKLVVVGEGGTGKTSLLRRLRGHNFRPDENTTHGIRVEHLSLPHPSEKVTMDLRTWDFGGQQIYHATHQFFLTQNALFILVWNARLGYEQGRVAYWLDNIKARAPGSPVLLVATHIDQRNADIPLRELKQRHPNLIDQIEVSSKDGDGLEVLTKALQTEAAKLPLMGEIWPKSWLNVAERLGGSVSTTQTPWWRRMFGKNTAPRPDYITAQTLADMMTELGIDDEISQDTLSRWLHELGEILWFKDDADPELRDTVILNPEWVTQNISEVLSSGKVAANRGLFTRAQMRKLWDHIDPNMHRRLLLLMERFDLSYRIPESETSSNTLSLVVEHLQYEPPLEHEDRWAEKADERELRLEMRLAASVPPGIPTWFIARQHRFSMQLHWRHGALMQDREGRHLALVRVEMEPRLIKLAVRGPNPYQFFALIRDGLELTLARYPGLELTRVIPCCGHNGLACEGEFELDKLEAAYQNGEKTMQCTTSFEHTPLATLLFGLPVEREGDRRDVSQQLEIHEEQPQQLQVRLMKDLIIGQSEMLAELRSQKIAFREMAALVQRQFSRLHRVMQRLHESHTPNVFTLRPVNQNTWLPDKLTSQKLGLQLYCQFPGHWHPAEDKGYYEFDQAPDWLLRMAPYVKALNEVLRWVVPVAGPWLKRANEVVAAEIENDVKLMEGLGKSLDAVSSRLEKEDRHGLAREDEAGRVEGAPLRELRYLLDKLDAKHHWGGLRKLLTPEGDYLWLCPYHYEHFARL